MILQKILSNFTFIEHKPCETFITIATWIPRNAWSHPTIGVISCFASITWYIWVVRSNCEKHIQKLKKLNFMKKQFHFYQKPQMTNKPKILKIITCLTKTFFDSFRLKWSKELNFFIGANISFIFSAIRLDLNGLKLDLNAIFVIDYTE